MGVPNAVTATQVTGALFVWAFFNFQWLVLCALLNSISGAAGAAAGVSAAAPPAWFSTLATFDHLVEEKPPYRELVADSEHALTKLNWTVWTHGLSPEPSGVWFTRDDDALSLTVLPTNVGGIYEIGVSIYDKDPNPTAVYIGRAQKVRKGTKGASLRQRISYEYCKSGGHLANYLRPLLELGFHVFFRWSVHQTTGSCEENEKVGLNHYNYAINRIQNGVKRDFYCFQFGKVVRLKDYALKLQYEVADEDVRNIVTAFRQMDASKQSAFLKIIVPEK